MIPRNVLLRAQGHEKDTKLLEAADLNRQCAFYRCDAVFALTGLGLQVHRAAKEFSSVDH